MSRSVQILLNWLAAITVITINALANILPINGLTTAQVSNKFPNLFVPAGFTFGIWGLIYLLHILFASYGTYMLTNEKRASNGIGKLIQKINPYFVVTCLLNSCWIFAWHYLHIGLSVIIMVALFLTLFLIFRILTISERTLAHGYLEHVSIETPFIIYFSWIAVALIANVTAWLVSINWQGAGIEEWKWSCIMISVAAALGVWLSLSLHRPAYTAVIIWAIIGIYVKQSPASIAIKYNSIAAGSICVVAAVAGFWHKRKLLFTKSSM